MIWKIMDDTWEEGKEAPSIYFQRIRVLQDRINAAYRADAVKHEKQDDPSVRSDKILAISDFVLRDIALSNLPERYAENLIFTIDGTTSFDDFASKVTNLYEQRQAWKEIATMNARRDQGDLSDDD